MVYTYNGVSFTLNKNEILIHVVTRMNLKDIMLSEISQLSEMNKTNFV